MLVYNTVSKHCSVAKLIHMMLIKGLFYLFFGTDKHFRWSIDSVLFRWQFEITMHDLDYTQSTPHNRATLNIKHEKNNRETHVNTDIQCSEAGSVLEGHNLGDFCWERQIVGDFCWEGHIL